MDIYIDMKISNQIQKFNNNVNFSSNERNVRGENKQIISNYTKFFRDDLTWNEFADFLIDKYKHQKKVNVYCYACSDGTEPFSLAIMLISKLGNEGAKKFFPIIAVDKDDTFLNEARQGRVKVSLRDLSYMEMYLGKSASKYIKTDDRYVKIDDEDDDLYCQGKVVEKVRDAVVFKQGDILEDIGNFEPDNSIIMFRNAWPYLDYQGEKELAQQLKEKLGKNSICVLGEYDAVSDAHKELREAGLKESNKSFHCYQQPSFTGNDSLSNPQYLFNVFVNKKSN